MIRSFPAAQARLFLLCSMIFVMACKDDSPSDKRITVMDSLYNATLAKQIESGVSPNLHEGFTMKLWAVDSLVSDPVSLDIDNFGRIYYTRIFR